ncbi:MAG: hypothetical protein HY559_04575 [Gammaproteobacteria bacterium]|nr:hypothetical protein [Gammaproteobacteria bacterium]
MKHRFKQILWFSGFFLLALLLALGLFFWKGEIWTGEGGVLETYKVFLTFLRFSFIVVLVVVWPYLVRYFAKRGAWPVERLKAMAALRWKVAALLVAIEILIIENWLGRIF